MIVFNEAHRRFTSALAAANYIVLVKGRYVTEAQLHDTMRSAVKEQIAQKKHNNVFAEVYVNASDFMRKYDPVDFYFPDWRTML